MKKSDVKKPARKFDVGLSLVVGAAAFQAYQFGRALNVYDPNGWSFKGVNIGGLFLGIIINVIVAVAATKIPLLTAAATPTTSTSSVRRLPSPKSKKKRLDLGELRRKRIAMKAGVQARFAQAAFFSLMALSPFLVAPAWYILWSALPLPPILIGFLCVGWAIAPDLGIALGGFVAGRSLVSLGSDAERRSASLKSRSADKPATLTDVPSVGETKIYRCVCGETFVDRFVYSGHSRTCATRKEIRVGKSLIPVDLQSTKKVVK